MKKKSAAAPIDRRSQRTRDALHDTLIVLMAERNWDDIAVRDLCDRANIGRSTFYSHYPNKDALLVDGFDALRAELRRQALERSPSPGRGGATGGGLHFALGLIEHAHEQRVVFRAIIGRRSGFVVQQRFREMVIRLVSDELPPSAGGLPRQAVARWLAGAFVELLSWWIEQRAAMAPAELAAAFNVLARPALEPARLPA